jgi:hypothetical protein
MRRFLTISSGVQEFRSSGVQEFRSSGVQEFRSSGVQEFRSIHGEKKASKVKNFKIGRIRISAGRILQLLNSCNS